LKLGQKYVLTEITGCRGFDIVIALGANLSGFLRYYYILKKEKLNTHRSGGCHYNDFILICIILICIYGFLNF